MKTRKPILFSSALFAVALLATSAVSHMAQERAFPSGQTHATSEMMRAFPDRF